MMLKLICDTLDSWNSVDAGLKKLQGLLRTMETKLNSLLGKMGDITTEELESLVEREMKSMDKAIQNASGKIQVNNAVKLHIQISLSKLSLQEMLAKSRQEDSGVRLEVNEKILDACTSLMQVWCELN